MMGSKIRQDAELPIACIQFRKKKQRNAEVPIAPAKSRKSVIIVCVDLTCDYCSPLHPRDSENQVI